MQLTDSSGNASAAGGAVTVNLDTTAPLAPSNVISVPIAANGINSTEKSAGVQVTVDLTGTNAVANDSVEILLGKFFRRTSIVCLDCTGDFRSFCHSDDSVRRWVGADGTKTISALVIDGREYWSSRWKPNDGFRNLDAIRFGLGLTAYTDVDSSGTISATDTYVFTISEATDKAVGIGSINVSNSHTLGAGATAVWE